MELIVLGIVVFLIFFIPTLKIATREDNPEYQRVKELDSLYPVEKVFYNPKIYLDCSKKEFENPDFEQGALDFLKIDDKAFSCYETIQRNKQNQVLYELAFAREIKDKKLSKKLHRPTGGCLGLVVARYSHKVNGKIKVETKVETVDLVPLIKEIKSGYVRKSSKQRFAKEQRAAMTPSMRYDVLKRDGFRCQICGSTQEDGVKLHVDHIIPVSKGGKTEMKNLRTLCDLCNIGKGAKIEDDRVIGATIGSIDNNLGS